MAYQLKALRGETALQEAVAAPPPPAVRSAAVRALHTAESVIKAGTRPILLATLGLLVVWVIGRIMETVHGNAVFDAALTYWFGLTVGLLLLLWAFGSAWRAVETFPAVRRNRRAVAAWLLFLLLLVAAFWNFGGIRVAVAGLLAGIEGSAESSAIATFLLFKYHGAGPLLAPQLAFAKLMGLGWGVDAIAPFVWGWNALFAFFIWSVGYGIVLMLQKALRGPAGIHLAIAAFGLLTLIVLKSMDIPDTAHLVVIQAAVNLMIVFQLLLAYGVLRVTADAGKADTATRKQEWAPRPSPDEERRPAVKPFAGLPPPALRLALAFFLVAPVLADIQNQFQEAAADRRTSRQAAAGGEQAARGFLTATSVIVRSGPAAGAETLTVLPKGARVEALELRRNWVRIADGHWVSDRFLIPVERR